MPTRAFAEIRAARHSQNSRNPFHAGPGFRGFTGSHLLRPVRLLAPLDGSDRVSPATGGFYIQASDGSVALPVAGYDYNSLWTPLLAGLSPAGMAASLAAPDLTGFPRPPGAFTSRLPTGRSPSPSLDMTTTALDSSVGGTFTRRNAGTAASLAAPDPKSALAHYRRRWAIETLFAA